MKLSKETACYPWQRQQWQHLLSLKIKQQMPHALLLVGYRGLGKLSFAQNLAKTLLCTQGQSESCNICRDCYLYEVASHPDYNLLSPQAEATAIKIDEIRRLILIANQTPQQAASKVIVIEPAEAMNMAAANALLKTLEEPPGKTHFLLVSHQLNQLPATIRSRCQIIRFSAPTFEDGCAWIKQQGKQQHNIELMLSLADHSPLLAMQLMQTTYLEQRNELLADLERLIMTNVSLVGIAEQWLKKDYKLIIKLLLNFIVDMIRLKSQLNLGYITNKDIVVSLQTLASSFEQASLYVLLDKLYHLRQLLMGTANINPQLLLEDFLATLVTIKNIPTDSMRYVIGSI